MLLNITHNTTYKYNPSATAIALRLRLFPCEFEGQKVHNWTVKINGKNVKPLLTDGYGEELGLWHIYKKCRKVRVTASGLVETQDRSGVVGHLSKLSQAGIFLRSTPLTKIEQSVKDLASELTQDADLDKMHALSKLIYDRVEYTPGVTKSETSAAAALALGQGVCQDHAHIFIAAARYIGLPARYITGYMIDGENQDILHETHAWAEAFIKDIGWVGFDPSSGICPTERYVRIASGLDAYHAAPIRGNIIGDSKIGLTEAVVNMSVGQQSQMQAQ